MPVIIISYYKQLLLLLQSSLSIQGWGAVPGTIPPRKAKSKVAQVPNIKWHSTLREMSILKKENKFVIIIKVCLTWWNGRSPGDPQGSWMIL